MSEPTESVKGFIMVSSVGLYDIFSIFDASRIGNEKYMTLSFITWALIFGIILSFIIIYYNKRIIGAFIRALLNSGANDAESAKTVSELSASGYSSAVSTPTLIRSFSTRSGTIVDMTEKEGRKFNDSTKFYISENNRLKAIKMYDDKGTSVLAMVLVGCAYYCRIYYQLYRSCLNKQVLRFNP